MAHIEFFSYYQEYFIDNGLDSFENIMNLPEGEVFKANKHRSVVKFSLHQTDFFCKRHFKPETKDKWRDLLSFHWPLSDGKQELENIRAISSLGIPTMKPIGWGEENGIGFLRQSFILTESLGDLERLEDYIPNKFIGKLTKEKIKEKHQLIQKVAHLVLKVHAAKMCHRDLYCGHILVKNEQGPLATLFLIDLQRVRQYRHLRRRWRTKDLAALNYTADPQAISKTDRLRFFLTYQGLPVNPPSQLNSSLKKWIRQILRRTTQMDRHTTKKQKRHIKESPL